MPVMDVDTALQTIGFGCAQVIIFWVSFFLYMYSVCESMSISYLVVLTACEFATTQGEKTFLASSVLSGMVFSGFFVGFLADKYGRRRVILISLIGALTASVISVFMPELYSLAIMRMVVGIFLSGLASLQVAFLGEFYAPNWRPTVVTVCSHSVTAALIYCPLVAMFYLPTNYSWLVSSSYNMRTWRFLMLIVQIPGWITLVGLLFVPETPHFLMSVQRQDQAVKVLQWIARLNRKKWEDFDISLAEDPRKTIVEQQSFFRNFIYESFRLFQPPYVVTYVISLLLIFGLFFTSLGLGIWFPVIRNMDNSGDNRLCDLVVQNPNMHDLEGSANATEVEPPVCVDTMTNLVDPIYYALAYMGCYLLSTLLLQCLIRKYVLTLHCSVAFILGVSLNGLSQPTLVLICFVGMMTMPGVLIPLATSVLIDALPIHLRGKAICMVRSLARTGAVLGSTLVGFLIHVSCDLTLNVFNFYLAVCIVLTIFLPK